MDVVKQTACGVKEVGLAPPPRKPVAAAARHSSPYPQKHGAKHVHLAAAIQDPRHVTVYQLPCFFSPTSLLNSVNMNNTVLVCNPTPH